MTHTEFLAAWKKTYPNVSWVLNAGEVYCYANRASNYVRTRCPYCAKTKLGPDTGHHLHAHFEAGWFKCQRCGTGGSTDYLLWIKSKPKETTPWKSYSCTEETLKVDPAILARSRGLEGSRVKPGLCIPIQDAPRSHPAWGYLLHEGFSKNQILAFAEAYGIHVCLNGTQFTDNPENVTTGRLIFEIRDKERLLGWQARWLPKVWPPTQEDLAMSKRVQKYLISPGLRKTHLLYNWGPAQKWDMWVVVEGIKKVWKTGPFALGSFGVSNQVNPPEETSERAHNQYWSVRLANGKRPIVLLYDKGAEEAGRRHAEGLRAMGCEVLIATLPESGADDLDDYLPQEILQIIKNTAGRLPKRK